MNIKTKFNVGDEVFVLVGTKLEKRTVDSMSISVEKNGQIFIKYWFRLESGNYESVLDAMVFADKGEFFDQLEKTEDPFATIELKS